MRENYDFINALKNPYCIDQKDDMKKGKKTMEQARAKISEDYDMILSSKNNGETIKLSFVSSDDKVTFKNIDILAFVDLLMLLAKALQLHDPKFYDMYMKRMKTDLQSIDIDKKNLKKMKKILKRF